MRNNFHYKTPNRARPPALMPFGQGIVCTDVDKVWRTLPPQVCATHYPQAQVPVCEFVKKGQLNVEMDCSAAVEECFVNLVRIYLWHVPQREARVVDECGWPCSFVHELTLMPFELSLASERPRNDTTENLCHDPSTHWALIPLLHCAHVSRRPSAYLRGEVLCKCMWYVRKTHSGKVHVNSLCLYMFKPHDQIHKWKRSKSSQASVSLNHISLVVLRWSCL